MRAYALIHIYITVMALDERKNNIEEVLTATVKACSLPDKPGPSWIVNVSLFVSLLFAWCGIFTNASSAVYIHTALSTCLMTVHSITVCPGWIIVFVVVCRSMIALFFIAFACLTTT
jgi:hypothetical protein